MRGATVALLVWLILRARRARHEKATERPDRIENEAIVDARPEEQAMGWYYYLDGKIRFPFGAKCIATTVRCWLFSNRTMGRNSGPCLSSFISLLITIRFLILASEQVLPLPSSLGSVWG
jgi:hypothetical protein